MDLQISYAQKTMIDKFIDKIEYDIEHENGPMWLKPWTGSGPTNAATGRSYTGINYLLLQFDQLINEYTTNKWITFKQAKKHGGQVRKGSKAQTVIFYSQVPKQKARPDDKEEFYFMAKVYHVFNISQVDNLNIKQLDTENENETIENRLAADTVIDNYINGVKPGQTKIASFSPNNNGPVSNNRAFYNPKTDYINLPKREQFITNDEYYSTVFHELIHSTGHPKRLNRFNETNEEYKNHLESYASEELTAEFGNALLCQFTGIENNNVEKNSVEYLKSWLQVFKNEPKLLLTAASKAYKAMQHVVNGTQQTT